MKSGSSKRAGIRREYKMTNKDESWEIKAKVQEAGGSDPSSPHI